MCCCNLGIGRLVLPPDACDQRAFWNQRSATASRPKSCVASPKTLRVYQPGRMGGTKDGPQPLARYLKRSPQSPAYPKSSNWNHMGTHIYFLGSLISLEANRMPTKSNDLPFNYSVLSCTAKYSPLRSGGALIEIWTRLQNLHRVHRVAKTLQKTESGLRWEIVMLSHKIRISKSQFDANNQSSTIWHLQLLDIAKGKPTCASPVVGRSWETII